MGQGVCQGGCPGELTLGKEDRALGMVLPTGSGGSDRVGLGVSSVAPAGIRGLCLPMKHLLGSLTSPL